MEGIAWNPILKTALGSRECTSSIHCWPTSCTCVAAALLTHVHAHAHQWRRAECTKAPASAAAAAHLIRAGPEVRPDVDLAQPRGRGTLPALAGGRVELRVGDGTPRQHPSCRLIALPTANLRIGVVEAHAAVIDKQFWVLVTVPVSHQHTQHGRDNTESLHE